MDLSLIIDGIKDPVGQENFIKLTEVFNDNPFLKGNFKHYEREVVAGANVKVKHLLGFRPKDAILTNVTNGAIVSFNYDNFDIDDIELNVSVACTIRFILGSVRL